MDFSFDEDQRELRSVVADFLERHATSPAVREAAESNGFATEQWGRLTGEMELSGLAIAPELGGAGASFVEVGIAIEEIGRTLLPVPYLSTVTAAAVLSHICSAEDAAPLLERIAGGAAAAVSLGSAGASAAPSPGVLPTLGAVYGLKARKHGDGVVVDGEAVVVDGATAEVLVLAAERDGEPVLVAVEAAAPGVTVEPLATLDQTRRQARVRLDGASGTVLAAGSLAHGSSCGGV